MNIYIKPELEEKLRKEDSMSGIINQLLADHYLLKTAHGKFVRLNDLEKDANNVIQSKYIADDPTNELEESEMAAQLEDDFDRAKRYYTDPTYTDPEATA